MRHITLFLLFCVCSTAYSQVNFQTLDWQQAKDLAGKENKYLLVDCFTTWCTWCKVMDKQTFPDEEVSRFMNDNMVAIKIDMEKGFGIELGHKFHITGYPTYLILNPKGDLVKVSIGYQEAALFLAMLKENTDPSKQKALNGYSQKIPESYPDFLTAYWKDKNNKPGNEQIAAYFDKTENKFSEAYWAVLCRFYGIDKKYFQQIADKRERYRSLFGTDAVNDALQSALNKDFSNAVKNKDEEMLNQFLKQMNDYELTSDPETVLFYRLAFYQQTKDWKKLMEQMEAYIRIHGEGDVALNEYCWAIYEQCDDPAVVERATAIMKSVTAAHPMYAETDTYAALLYKSKKYDEAEAAALKAIELGKADGSDVSSTEELLKKIREAKPK